MRSRTTLAIAIMVSTVAGVLVSATPASASVPGLVMQTLTSPSNASSSKTVVATCPAGTNVIGGGGDVFNGDGKVAIEQILPDLGTRTLQVTAKEVDAYGLNWEVTARALCAPTPAGLVRVHSFTAATAVNKSRTANCPAGTTVLGAGFDIGNGFGEVVVNKVVPNGGVGVAATSVTASAYEEDPYAANWSLHVYLLCANAIAGQEVITASTGFDSLEPKAVNATCPAGKDATGGGVELTTTMAGLEGELSVDSVLAFSLGGASAADTIQGIAYEADNIGSTWDVTSYTFCT